MIKRFCDFCKNEIQLDEVCTISLREPQKNKDGEVDYFDGIFECCPNCFAKIKGVIGIK